MDLNQIMNKIKESASEYSLTDFYKLVRIAD